MRFEIIRNFFWLCFVQGANFLAPLIVFPFASKALGEKDFSLLLLYFAAINTLFIFTDYGFSLSATVKIAKVRNDAEAVSKVLSIAFSYKIYIIPILILILILSVFFDESAWLIYTIILLTVISQSFQASWIFQGLGDFRFFGIITGIIRLFYAIFVSTSIFYFKSVFFVMFSWFVCNFLIAFFTWLYILKKGFVFNFMSLSIIFDEIKKTFDYFLSRVSVMSYTTAAPFFVGFSGASNVANYGIADQLYRIGQNIASSFNLATIPTMIKHKNWKKFSQLVLLFLFIIIIYALVVFEFGEGIISVIYGDQYKIAIDVVNILMFVLPINLISISLGYPVFSVLGYEKFANYSLIFGALFFLIILIFIYLFFEFSAVSIAVAILLSEIFVMFFRLSIIIYIKYK